MFIKNIEYYLDMHDVTSKTPPLEMQEKNKIKTLLQYV